MRGLDSLLFPQRMILLYRPSETEDGSLVCHRKQGPRHDFKSAPESHIDTLSERLSYYKFGPPAAGDMYGSCSQRAKPQ